MAVQDFFVWGGAGQKLTPGELARRREIEDALISKGPDFSPVGHWTQGLGRVANAAAGAFRRHRLNEQEGELQEYQGGLRTKIADLLAGGSSAPSSIPMTAAAGEVSATAPGASSAPSSGLLPASFLAAVDTSEGGGGYDTLYGHAQRGKFAGTDVSAMPIRDVIAFTDPSGPYAQSVKSQIGRVATPVGRHQIVGATLRNAVAELGLDPNITFDQAVQDQIALHLAKKRVASADTLPGKISALRSEWHGFKGVPDEQMAQIVADIQGAPVEVAAIEPQTATDAIESVSPTAFVDPAVSAPNYDPVAASAPTVPNPQAPAPVSPQPVQVAQSSGINPAIIEALTDPRADEGTRRLAAILVEQQQAREAAAAEEQNWRARQQYEQELLAQDPLRQQQLEKGKLEIESLRNPQPKDTDEIREYNFARSQGFEGTFADFKQQMKKAGATNVTTNVGEGDKFYENLDKKNAETFATLSDSGVQARGKMVQIDRLDALLAQSPQGMEAGVKQWLGDMGIATEGLDTIQATRALLERMVPEQRPPGSGPMSDADIVMFRNSLPRLINQPGGNQTILQTMRGIAQYEMEMGQIADMVADRAVSPTEGRKMIRELRNPLEDFNKRLKEFGNQKQDAGAPPAGIDPADWEFMTPEERKLFQ